MSRMFGNTARLMTRATIAVSIAILAMGCGKKETKEADTSKAMQTEEPAAASMPQDIAGTYTAEVPGGDTPGRKVSLTLNSDHTAVMSTDYMNDKPAITKDGTWAEAGESMIDCTFQDDAGQAMTMTFHVGANEMHVSELHMMNAEQAGFGSEGMTLMKAGMGMDMDSPEEQTEEQH